MDRSPVQALSAVALFTADMAASVDFYETVGLTVIFGGPDTSFTTMDIGSVAFLNLQFDPTWTVPERTWGRFIMWVDDVDAAHARLVDAGYTPTMAPSDAAWGERYFHITDPAGHEVSVSRRL